LLEAWLCRLSRHPVIAKFEEFRKFVTAADEQPVSRAAGDCIIYIFFYIYQSNHFKKFS